MKVWEIVIKLESPTILTKRRTSSGFAGPLEYIPSSTLRGALLSALYREGIMDEREIQNEAEAPTIITSPAYPMENAQRMFPAHPFIQKCKVCGEKVPKGITPLARLAGLEGALKRGEEPGVEVECSNGHRALKPLHPGNFMSILEDGQEMRTSSKEDEAPSTIYSISVGISRARGAGVKGLLYSYEALSPGREFWATLASRDELRVPRKLKIAIGRGISRGYGRATLSAQEHQPKPYTLPEDGQALFYALSPLLGNAVGDNIQGTFPTTVDLNYIADRAGVQASGAVHFERAFGRATWVSAGWDMAKGELRPQIQCRPPGSLLWGRVSASDGLALTALRYFGTVERIGQHVLAGFNLLIPVGALKDAP